MANNYAMYLTAGSGAEGFSLPKLPEKIKINYPSGNKTFELVNLGEVSLLKSPKLSEISFDAYFPAESTLQPSFYLDIILAWKENKQVVRFIFTGSTLDINMLVSIESFEAEEKAGEVGDIYYSIKLKKYVPYQAKKLVVTSNQNKVQILSKSSTTRPVERAKPNTYTVRSGDTLWAIAKKLLSDGSRYKEIASLNSIQNPNRIYPGQVLKIP